MTPPNGSVLAEDHRSSRMSRMSRINKANSSTFVPSLQFPWLGRLQGSLLVSNLPVKAPLRDTHRPTRSHFYCRAAAEAQQVHALVRYRHKRVGMGGQEETAPGPYACYGVGSPTWVKSHSTASRHA